MSSQTTDDEVILRAILYNMRYVNEPTIERFFNNYRIGKEVFNKKPELLCQFMEHMFGPNQGETAFEIFKEVRKK